MFKIKWTPEAEELYLDTLSFWINHNGSNDYSLKIIEEVETTEAALKLNPYLGSLVEGKFVDEVRRILILKEFSLFYRVTKNNIEVLSFWSNRNDPEKLKI